MSEDLVTMNLEICVDSVESAIAAARGGADRLELCSALSEGGITPSSGLIAIVRGAIGIPLYVIVRPRGGNFVYSESDLAVMRADIASAKAQGVDGVVLGALNADDTVDRAHISDLVELARPMQVTFHRAFDACRDFGSALEDVIACGADRLLTAGGPLDARNNLEAIAELQLRATGRIRIMAGGGIRIGNVREVVVRTVVGEVHTSLNTGGGSAGREGGANGGHSRFPHFVVRESEVRALRSVLQEIALKR